MRGYKLRIKIAVTAVVTVTLVMVVLGLFPSWSKYAKSNLEILLDAALLGIIFTALELAAHYYDKDRVLITVFKIPVRLHHLDRFIAFMFMGVLLTDVVQDALSIPHYIFTGLGALGFFLRLILFYKKGDLMQLGSIICAVIGAIGFIVGLTTDFYSVAIGELLFEIAIIPHILATIKGDPN